MKRVIPSVIFLLIFTSLVSAGLVEIIFNEQPSEIYNLGETIFIPVKIKSNMDITGSFQMNLFCEGHEVNFYKNGISLKYGEEVNLETSLVLDKETIEGLKGGCKIKGIFKDDSLLTNEFVISENLNIKITNKESVFNPGESISITGEAFKESGKGANGFMLVEVDSINSTSLTQLDTINNGFFKINLLLPENTKAGDLSIKLEGYERNFMGETTNQGSIIHTITIKQIPTSLEILFAGENENAEPGKNLQVKAILHDQTGDNIATGVVLNIYDEKNKLLERIETTTDEIVEYPIAYNQAPTLWKIIAESGEFNSEMDFQIIEKESVNVELLNKTVVITNTGNIPYNKSVLVKIQGEPLNIDVSLKVDESKKYLLTAPNGEYEIEVITEEGSAMTGMATLTGKTINVKETGGVRNFGRPVVWIFMIFILGFVAFMVAKKGYRRSFIGYITRKKFSEKPVPLSKKSIVTTSNKAELSLSIQGTKQDVSLICLNLRNLKEIESNKSSAEETLQKIVTLVEKNKGVVYENQDNLFFIFVPSKTKTFRNEKTAIELAINIKGIIKEHNKIFKSRIDSGIALNYGSIVAKQEAGTMLFMSMGKLISSAKKIASHSLGEVFLTEEINSKLGSEIKTTKHTKDNFTVYTIKEIKGDEHKKFISSFLHRLEEDNKRKK